MNGCVVESSFNEHVFIEGATCSKRQQQQQQQTRFKKMGCQKSNSFHLCAHDVVFAAMKIHHRTPEEVCCITYIRIGTQKAIYYPTVVKMPLFIVECY